MIGAHPEEIHTSVDMEGRQKISLFNQSETLYDGNGFGLNQRKVYFSVKIDNKVITDYEVYNNNPQIGNITKTSDGRLQVEGINEGWCLSLLNIRIV